MAGSGLSQLSNRKIDFCFGLGLNLLGGFLFYIIRTRTMFANLYKVADLMSCLCPGRKRKSSLSVNYSAALALPVEEFQLTLDTIRLGVGRKSIQKGTICNRRQGAGFLLHQNNNKQNNTLLKLAYYLFTYLSATLLLLKKG